MPFIIEELRPHLQAFDFIGLFVEGLGWDHYQAEAVKVQVNDCEYSLKPIAEKAGFVVYECNSGTDDKIPQHPIRRKIESRVSKLAFEHLIIFVDPNRKIQIWQWVKRESGKQPVGREQKFHAGHSGESILQRLQEIAFTLDDENRGIGISDVTTRVHKAFDIEKVTKRFYEGFRTEIIEFGNFIKGITDKGDRDWYASLMLNRMMFIYFIQKQGFLNEDSNYLRNKLREVQSKQGGGRFQQFYRIFLLRLFHEGLGQPEAQREPDLVALLGKVPFLNGGLFDVHDLERDNPDISIPDEAFQRVFNFFDSYRWHLDERPFREDNEINPDVLGYIFEKYINQKEMGAYYTKEDITGYISCNSLIPFIFDEAKKKCPVAFGPDGSVWQLLQGDPDSYIYPAVAHGITWNARQVEDPKSLDAPFELPDEIIAGIENESKRQKWDDYAPEDYALPKETWREVVARRQYYTEVHTKLVSGTVQEINDLITLNLDIEQFSIDVIAQSEGSELLRAFWQAIRDVSVLDPTCGSGAFLFAALNVLEPLYDSCLKGMQGFLDDLERTERPHHPDALRDFRNVLEQVKKHPNERYFILKSIVLNNLYGVDIMDEAVEICKLRLFLKLVAQLQTYDQIEPLPDIDFNVRAGNTLVGFTSLDTVREAMTATLDGQHRVLFEEDLSTLQRIEEEAAIASAAFNRFRLQQTIPNNEVTATNKAELQQKFSRLSNELDRYLATDYGIDANDSEASETWRSSHRPFHWFVEFHGVMSNGGFDVVIGNPPYVARRKVTQSYTPKGFRTEACPDIYATVAERSIDVCRTNGRTSMIVPLNLTFSSQYAKLRTHLYDECRSIWFSSFGRIPSALFSFDTRVRNTIYLAHKSSNSPKNCFTTRLHRWFDSQRPTLFNVLSYSKFSPEPFSGLVPKLGSAQLIQDFESLQENGASRLQHALIRTRDGHPLHFKQTAYNWLTFCVEQPPAYDSDDQLISQTKYGTVYFRDSNDRDIAMLLLNSKLTFIWWVAFGDDFDLTQKNFTNIPFRPAQLTKQQQQQLLTMIPVLKDAMNQNLVFKLNARKKIGNYNLARCRHITDIIDKIWLSALGLSELWDEIELEHSLFVRTSFNDED